MSRSDDALRYHSQGRPGKIEVVPTKAVATQLDLSLAYSPGVAAPCREIARDRSTIDKYTARRNLVAVITNGTAVLGLGDIGPYAAKPVMEGKGVLFKRFADIDVFDLEIAEKDPQRFIDIVASLEPTFGGINLEDIKAPECFVIERALRERMKIPVFHDDQHGTAIISAAALENAAEVQRKKLSDLRVVCLGAGAAALSCMELWIQLGVRRENIALVDRQGVVREDRQGGVESFRAAFALPAEDPRRTLLDCFEGADVMCGLSGPGLVDEAMLKRMNDRPIVFALANPDPEVPYEVARAVRPDAIVATGRSDYPNQVNNVLGFPYIFRGALDIGARTINEEMKLAAARAIARLAHEDVPDEVRAAYGGKELRFGAEYVIPKPFDSRVLHWVAPAVAQAAMQSGVTDEVMHLDAYRERLTQMLSPTRRVMWNITARAKAHAKRIVYPEGDEPKILRAAAIVRDEGIASPILIGAPDLIRARAADQGVALEGMTIVDPPSHPRIEAYVAAHWQRRARKGVTEVAASRRLRRNRTYFGMMMVEMGDADGIVCGLTQAYSETIRPALEVIGPRADVARAAGMYMVITQGDVKFLADTTINIDPDAETLASTAILAADAVKRLGIVPRVAMLSFSNFGDAPHPSSAKVARATALVKGRRPDLMVDGEMQANVALDAAQRERYPFCALEGSANVLVFPNLDAGNIAYKLLASIGRGNVIGPIVLGMNRPVNALQQGASVDDIVHMTSITVAGVEA